MHITLFIVDDVVSATVFNFVVADYGNAQKFATFPRNAQMPGAPAYGNEYMGGSNFRGTAGSQQNK